MQKLAEYWNDRSASQKRLIGAAFLLTFLAVAGFAWLASRTPMALLYSGLDSARAGEVMAELDKTGIPSEIRGDAIWVAEAERDRLRMTLAGIRILATATSLAKAIPSGRSARSAIGAPST